MTTITICLTHWLTAASIASPHHKANVAGRNDYRYSYKNINATELTVTAIKVKLPAISFKHLTIGSTPKG